MAEVSAPTAQINAGEIVTAGCWGLSLIPPWRLFPSARKPCVWFPFRSPVNEPGVAIWWSDGGAWGQKRSTTFPAFLSLSDAARRSAFRERGMETLGLGGVEGLALTGTEKGKCGKKKNFNGVKMSPAE